LSKLALFFFHPPVTHRLVLGGVGFHLTAIDRHPPQFHRPGLQRQTQNLLKQPFHSLAVNLAEIAQRTKIRRVPRGQHPKRYILNQTFLDPPRCKYSVTIRIDQYLDHHAGMVRRLPSFLVLVDGFDLGKIQIIDQVTEKICQVYLQAAIRAGSEASKTVVRVRTNDNASPWRYTTDLVRSDQEKNEFSDKLLALVMKQVLNYARRKFLVREWRLRDLACVMHFPS
jgi:hypothetical protein